ncbi:MAG: hypothetical protein HKN04_12985 [Rhodothermaceae bacterium]|nr:hypothetical protein [Rhodothermaceae bacterium]
MPRSLRFLSFALFMMVLAACDSAEPVIEPDLIQAEMVQDLPADPITGFNPTTGQPIGADVFTFFSLRTGEVVPNSDSASTAWDLGFKGTTIIVNGGTSGPGAGAAQVVTGSFEDLTEAPADGYATDADTGTAIATGSGNGWYNYNQPLNLVTPIPGRVLFIQTADGRYAKVRILNYYEGAPESPDPDQDTARYYTFEYVFQPDGSRTLTD